MDALSGALSGGLGILGIFIFIFLIVLGILWFILPFAVFGIKSRLELISSELSETRLLLSEIAKNTSTQSPNTQDIEKKDSKTILRHKRNLSGECVLCGRQLSEKSTRVFSDGFQYEMCTDHNPNQSYNIKCAVA